LENRFFFEKATKVGPESQYFTGKGTIIAISARFRNDLNSTEFSL